MRTSGFGIPDPRTVATECTCKPPSSFLPLCLVYEPYPAPLSYIISPSFQGGTISHPFCSYRNTSVWDSWSRFAAPQLPLPNIPPWPSVFQPRPLVPPSPQQAYKPPFKLDSLGSMCQGGGRVPPLFIHVEGPTLIFFGCSTLSAKSSA